MCSHQHQLYMRQAVEGRPGGVCQSASITPNPGWRSMSDLQCQPQQTSRAVSAAWIMHNSLACLNYRLYRLSAYVGPGWEMSSEPRTNGNEWSHYQCTVRLAPDRGGLRRHGHYTVSPAASQPPITHQLRMLSSTAHRQSAHQEIPTH